jgi:glycine cleavage system H protein
MPKKDYNIPLDLYYTETHEWLKITNHNIGIVGITDYAQDMLHEIVYVDLPEIGVGIQKGEVLMEIESVKSVAEVYAPVSGKIIEVNNILSDTPELVNESPYEKGWLVKMEISDINETKSLLSAEEYRSLIMSGK